MAQNIPANNLPEDIFEDSDDSNKPVRIAKGEETKPATPSVDDVLFTRGATQTFSLSKESGSLQLLQDEIKKKASIQQLDLEDETKVRMKTHIPQAPAVVAPPTHSDIQERSRRENEKKSVSSFLRIIFIVIIISIVIIVAGISFFYFNNTLEQSATILSLTEEKIEEILEPGEDIIDISKWDVYSNKKAGLTFSYPDTAQIELHDTALGAPNASGTPQVIVRDSKNEYSFSVWIDTVGISFFTQPGAPLINNPLNAGVHYILNHDERSGFVIRTVRYFTSRSGIIETDLSAITAYAPEQQGVFQYTFLYKDSRGEKFVEKYMDAFIGSIIVRSDEDSDGLYLDEEEALGTDPVLADTDGDGYTDKDEVTNGYNPLGEGTIAQ